MSITRNFMLFGEVVPSPLYFSLMHHFTSHISSFTNSQASWSWNYLQVCVVLILDQNFVLPQPAPPGGQIWNTARAQLLEDLSQIVEFNFFFFNASFLPRHGLMYKYSESKNRQYNGFGKMTVIYSLFSIKFNILFAIDYK